MKFFQCLHLLVLVISVNCIITSEANVEEKDDDDGILTLERVNFKTNKTIKILTGQKRPSQSQPPQMIQNYPPNYQQQQQQYPQSPYYPPQDQTGQGSGPQPSFQQPKPQTPSSSGVSEIYVQIVGAIEKLVGRMDKLDQRLATLENIVLHLTNKKDQPQQGNCPENFVKVDGIRNKCYHISTLPTGNKPRTLFDWQTAHKECGRLGGRLAEMVHYDDFLRISQFLVKHSDFKNTGSPQTATDYWIGGINPGLIWIWSESGQKVGMDNRFWNENDNSSNAPGCLKLSRSHRLDSFFFKGSPCSHSQNILCEVMDNSVSRALADFEQEIIIHEDTN